MSADAKFRDMKDNSPIGVLRVVATPIGNLEDITARAIRILQEADYILAEDTRVTGKLLKHYQIKTEQRQYHSHSSPAVHEAIISDLKKGLTIALVTDAGLSLIHI